MKLASIEVVAALESHNNADNLEIATVLGYKCIVQKNDLFVGDTVVFIQPDIKIINLSYDERK
jgi:hypothetical protein